jgi:ABC-2 type transport system permease protein
VTGLLRAELRRLYSRRLVRVLVALALLLILIVEVRAFFVSNRDLDAAHRRAAAEAQRAQNGDNGLFAVQACERARAAGRLPPDAQCPTVEDFRNQEPQNPDDYFQDPRFHSAKYLRDGARAVAGGMAMLAFIIGASFVGAEWHAGTMQALLLWESRRIRVVVAKAAALVLGLVAVTAALQAVVYGADLLIGATRGTTAGLTSGLHMSALLTVARGMLIVSATALLGFAIAGLARVTAAALGFAFGYFVIVENLIRFLRPGWERFLFTPNINAVLLLKQDVAPAHATRVHIEGLDVGNAYTLHAVRGVITLAIYLGILVGLFAWTFRRRDVT